MHCALFEIGTEELPAGALAAAGEALRKRVLRQLERAGMDSGELDCELFFSPRRLALRLNGLAEHSPSSQQWVDGPPLDKCYDAAGEPTAALTGFARKQGVAAEDLQQRQVKDVVRVAHRIERGGVPMAQLLASAFAGAVEESLLPGRTMSWADGRQRFLRPVRWLVAMLDDRVLPVHAFGLEAANLTRGHPVHAPEPLVVPDAADWADLLRRSRVEPSFAQRRQRIEEQAAACVAQLEGAAIGADSELLDELANLTEWPVALLCRFEPEHLQLPPAVIRAVLEKHQRYIPVCSADGSLQAAFVAIANLDSSDAAAVVAGNERVVRPRLQDADFFIRKDSEKTLDMHCERLHSVQFHANLGSLAEKQGRLEQLVGILAEGSDLSSGDLEHLKRAAALCKLDQASLMVQEFPHLQGQMAAHYARLAGEPEAVCTALAEHHWVYGRDGGLPTTPISRTLVLADRLDSLAGLFSVGEEPAADRDPLGLRRMALAIARLAVELGLDMPPENLATPALGCYPHSSPPDTARRVGDFIWGRFETLSHEHFPPEFLLATRPCSSGLFGCHQRMKALSQFISTGRGQVIETIAGVVRRCQNLLRRADDTPAIAGLPDIPDQAVRADRQLHEAVEAVSGTVAELIAAADYCRAVEKATDLASPLAQFFDEVMVMDENAQLRTFRLGLLRSCLAAFDGLADFSALAVRQSKTESR